ncbi:hypothetical protein JWG45_12100 [Leptospira sp. 201903070]|uniref:Uncharacterized protein n=1 Tax=Leptospira ainlahdjerensis TaxID=2810033 RepID=A0ABS2UBY4_9LEPT|nr:hypothetical protein [Leptospira ainlahdjerensis]MBM9577889.1 hypothetical protein [Leptospira ainlahdjerensis]
MFQPVENVIKIVRNPNAPGVSDLTSSVLKAYVRHNATATEREFVGTVDRTNTSEIE